MSLDQPARQRTVLSWLVLCVGIGGAVASGFISLSAAIAWDSAADRHGWPDWPLQLASILAFPMWAALFVGGAFFTDAVRSGRLEEDFWGGIRRPLRQTFYGVLVAIAVVLGVRVTSHLDIAGAGTQVVRVLVLVAVAVSVFEVIRRRWVAHRFYEAVRRADYDEALRRAGGSSTWWGLLVRSHLPDGRAEVASEVRGHLAHGDVVDPDVRRALTLFLIGAIVVEEPVEAEELLREVRAGDEEFFVQHLLGELLLLQGRTWEAKPHVDRAMELARREWLGPFDQACIVLPLRAWARAETGEPGEHVRRDIDDAVARLSAAHAQVEAQVCFGVAHAVRALGEDGADWLRRGAAADPDGIHGLRCTELLRSWGCSTT